MVFATEGFSAIISCIKSPPFSPETGYPGSRDGYRLHHIAYNHGKSVLWGLGGFCFCMSDEESAACQYADRPYVFIYEPNVAILKGGLYKSVSEKFGVKKLHQNSHLYTSEELNEEFPGRKFRVLSVFSMNKKELKRELADVSKANVSIRNFPLSAEELRKRLKLKEGGDIYIFATTLRNGDKVLVKCVKC